MPHDRAVLRAGLAGPAGTRRHLVSTMSAGGSRRGAAPPSPPTGGPGIPCVLVSSGHPSFRQVVLDATNIRELAEFYRELLGYSYRPGDEPPTGGHPDTHGSDWLVLQDSSGRPSIAFQQVDALPAATWPHGDVPQQLHLDLTVPTIEALDNQHTRASTLGARLLLNRSDDVEEPSRVYADPAGHPFCIFVAPPDHGRRPSGEDRSQQA